MGEHHDLLNERVHILLERGTFIVSETQYNYCFMLYQLDSRFVELLYDKRAKQVVWLNHANDHDLKKYLDKIKLNFQHIL
jgi:hypothetical protein